MTKTTRLPQSACPFCRAAMDAATHMRRATPKAGDITICFKCGHVCVFDDDLKVRNPTLKESIEISDNREVEIIRDAIIKKRAWPWI